MNDDTNQFFFLERVISILTCLSMVRIFFFVVRKAHKNNMAFYATYFGVILCDINKFYLLTII